MNSLSLSPILALSLATALAAQSVETLPKNMAMTEGSTLLRAPLQYMPARLICGYGANAVSWTGAKVIQKLTARADGTASLASALTVDMQVVLSSRGAKIKCESPVWDNNHGMDRRVFMKRKSVTLPPFTQVSGPRPFDIELKGDTAFVAATPQLLVDWAVYRSSFQFNTNYRLDLHASANTGSVGSGTSFGAACGPITNWSHLSWGYNIGNVLRIYGNTRRTGDIVLTWISPTASAVSIGGGCTVYADPFATGAVIYPAAYVTSTADGYYTFEWGVIPNALLNATIHSQALLIDPVTQQRGWSSRRTTTFGNLAPTIDMAYRYNTAGTAFSFDPDKNVGYWGLLGRAAIFKVN